tara:strand:- start:1692 stop:1868 length:177 start_codon:yes stop_codon:yes gene_type:complete
MITQNFKFIMYHVKYHPASFSLVFTIVATNYHRITIFGGNFHNDAVPIVGLYASQGIL